MGIAMTMPPLELRTGTAIRSISPAPIISVNKPVVSTPVPVPKPVATAPIAPAPVQTSFPVYVPPILPAPRPTSPPVAAPPVSTAENPVQIIRPVGPVYGPRPPILPAPRPTPAPVLTPPVSVNAGSPVPAGYPTSQLFVNTDGSFWQYSSTLAKWINAGTPYNTGASATPAAPPPSSSGGSTAPPAGTTAPPPVNVSIAPAASGYQEIFDWLQEDSLLSSIGFGGIPNWIVAGGGALLLYKVTSGGKR